MPMRSTFGQLLTKCYDNTQNSTNTSDTTLATYLKSEINNAVRFIYADLRNHMTTKAQTFTTVASQQYYYNPPDLMDIETVTVTIGSMKYVCRPVDSQEKWDRYNALTTQTAAYPEFFFQRRDDYGIWPIPQGAYTATINYTYRLKDMTATDYNTGTITVTNGSQTVTGSGTTFTSAMVGRWIVPSVDGLAYRVSAFNSTTSLTIQNYFQGTTIAGDTYTIGESPELPPDLHELLPYRVAMNYFAGFRKDKEQATYWSNMFWTGDPTNTSRDMMRAVGGYLGAKKRYSARSNSRIVRRGRSSYRYSDRNWGATFS